MDENLIKLFLPPLRAETAKKLAANASSENDAALILPLIILLMADGQDMMLIIALLSILL